MTYSLQVTRRFEKDFRRLSPDVKQRVDSQIRTLEDQPLSGKRLRGEFENSFSLRIGDYRIIHTLIEREKRVVLLTVGHRSKVYG